MGYDNQNQNENEGDWSIGSLHTMLIKESDKRRKEDKEFFEVNPPKKEFTADDVIYGVFDIDGAIYYAQKYSNGYHINNLIRVEADLIAAINEVIEMRIL